MAVLLEVSSKRQAERSTDAWRAFDLPFAGAIALYLSSALWIVARAWVRAHGHFIYTLDDVYINMAVAKNLVLHGVWGVSPFEFSSSTSSPLYILILAAADRLVGVRQYAPLAISSAFAIASLVVANQMLLGVSQRLRGIALVAFVLLSPLFAIGTLGMEHTLHLLLVLLFLRWFMRADVPERWIGLLTALMAGARFEGVLMAGVATVLLLVDGQKLRASVVAVAAWVPVGLYGAFSIRHGGYWLPNSVSIKGIRLASAPGLGRFGALIAGLKDHVLRAPHLVLLAIALMVITVALWRMYREQANLTALLAGSCVLHLVAADVGWAFRYETYLVGASLIVVAAVWPELSQCGSRAVLSAMTPFCLGVAVLVLRSGLALALLPEYSRAIYLQQWQTARFLSQAYAGSTVAANDIGAINYQADLHCVDLAGLATASVFDAKRNGIYTTSFLEQLGETRRIKVAVAYDSWFMEHPQLHSVLTGPPLPESWVRVRRWTVPEKQQLGGRTVSWYAVDPGEAPRLRAQLHAFEATLPVEVSVSD